MSAAVEALIKALSKAVLDEIDGDDPMDLVHQINDVIPLDEDDRASIRELETVLRESLAAEAGPGPMDRIASALERMSPPPLDAPDLSKASAFVWHVQPDRLSPVQTVNRVDLDLLVGIDRAQDILLQNTRQFAGGLPANNALLWGARGMGKSSLVKAVHGALQDSHTALKLVEIQREDLPSIGRLLGYLRGKTERIILFCDDLSFSHDDEHYKSLKAVLDGGVEGRPDNVIFYATSNRRHLMPRDMIENERASAINPSEATEEKVSLSDRFGLWLGFHPCSQDE